MRVIATAGHVDHGKSTLVRALTGMEPDRWAEERRRGMTIDLGYAWFSLAGEFPDEPAERVAFVDVPGHQKFVTNMLAGVGPVPAVLLVIAADQGWSRQTSEHLDAIEALGISHGVLAVTRADLASGEQLRSVLFDATGRLARSSLGAVEAVPVSGLTGAGLPELRVALRRLVAALPSPRTDGRVRLWVDRSFTVRGAGTVLTGTLGAGRIEVGDELELHGRTFAVRALQELGEPAARVQAVARVAVNLRGVDRDQVHRGDCLLSPGQWRFTRCLDVNLDPLLAEPAGEQVLHIGSASVPVRVRMLGPDTARLSLHQPIPVELGERAVLRDPGQQSVTAGVRVLDADPPELRMRGAARARGAELASGSAVGLTAHVRRRGAVTRRALSALGVRTDDTSGVLVCGDWLIDPATWQQWLLELARASDRHAEQNPQQPRIPEEAARRAVGVPDPVLLRELATEAGLQNTGGRLGRPGVKPSLGAATAALQRVLDRVAADPFDAPDRDELARLGLDSRQLAAAAENGQLLRLAPDLVVAVNAPERAVELLAALDGPFTASQARQRLATTRRIALPLLEYLDRAGLTVRVDSTLRQLRHVPGAPGRR